MSASKRTPSVTVRSRPTHTLLLLACCSVLLVCCTTCTATSLVLTESPRVSYDQSLAGCASIGGGLVEARSEAVTNEYVALLKSKATFWNDAVVFLGGSRDDCGLTPREAANCEWCWRTNWKATCDVESIFYRSAVRVWGRPVPGMYVNWAYSYPGGPRTQMFLGHSYRKGGWVDASYQSRWGMSHTLCEIPTVTPGESSTQAPGVLPDSSSFFGLEGEGLAAADRRGVKGNWWAIVAVLFVVCGALGSVLSYFVLRPSPEKEEEVYEEFDEESFEDDGVASSSGVEMETSSYSTTR